MPGTLYVVATPIGNLEDVTLRALRILREVSLIAAEDTRRTSRLLQHYSISTPTTSLHEHNERSKTPALIRRLLAGESLALVSDAGTPVVSDPGAGLVAAAHAAGVRVEPVPGPSAAIAALSASGFPADRFLFAGFPPPKGKARAEFFQALAEQLGTLVLYEAPHRIGQTLSALLETLGDRRVAIARELTKAHEELVIRPISAAVKELGDSLGEYCIVIEPKEPAVKPLSSPTAAQLASEFGVLTNNADISRRDAVRELALRHGLPARDVYRLLETAKNSIA